MSFYSFIQPELDFLLTEANIQMQRDMLSVIPSASRYSSGPRRLHSRFIRTHAHGGHLLKYSLISDLNAFFQVSIWNSLKWTIIYTTSIVICVNIFHENLKVHPHKS